MSDTYPPHYPAHNFYEPHQPYQQPQPYPQQSYPQEYPPPQWQSPPPQHQNYYGQPPQQPQWNPEQIWAEANGGSQNPHSSSNNLSRGNDFGGIMQGQPGGDGERGLGATVLGGGAGAFLGHELGHSKMATLGGIAVGAIAANAFEHHHKKKKEERRMEHAYDDGYVHGESRGIDDDYDDRSYASRRSRSIDRDDRYDGRRSLDRVERYDSRRSLDRYDDRDYESRRSFEEERDYEYEPPRHHHHHHHRDDYDDDYKSQSYYQQDDYYSRRDSRY
ncbi:hypothetical protein PRZ48_007530 [Zasmidium cellare]|uniref:Glycine zipper 2TM domain-containing protein n=1 Tax=Zasmidium cellare TaxID=395010 RepID=A0ABR0EJK8_ZASCE|nr:hypothetical protein PRZ48_007530 [Zasmidium cellare]